MYVCCVCRSLSAADEQEEAEQAQLLRLIAIRQQLRRTQAAAAHSACSCSYCCAPVHCTCTLHSSACQHCVSCAGAAVGGETVTERPQVAVKLAAHLQVRGQIPLGHAVPPCVAVALSAGMNEYAASLHCNLARGSSNRSRRACFCNVQHAPDLKLGVVSKAVSIYHSDVLACCRSLTRLCNWCVRGWPAWSLLRLLKPSRQSNPHGGLEACCCPAAVVDSGGYCSVVGGGCLTGQLLVEG